MVRWEMKHAATADGARCNGTRTAVDFLIKKPAHERLAALASVKTAIGEAGCADVEMRTKGMRGGDACM